MKETINNQLDFQPYNSNRPHLVIPEYGRNIQHMVEYAITLSDREERNKCVRAIISVMGQLFPHLRDIEDFNHKLWDHLHIMSGFRLSLHFIAGRLPLGCPVPCRIISHQPVVKKYT